MSKERVSGKQEHEAREPIIKQIGEVSLIGVSHLVDLEKQKTHTFAEIIHRSSHLLIEGTSTYRYVPLRNPRNYEELAESIFHRKSKQENIHFLEDDADEFMIADAHGIGMQSLLFWRSFVALDLMQRLSPEQFEELRNPRAMAEMANETSPLFSALGNEELEERMSTFIRDIRDYDSKGEDTLLASYPNLQSAHNTITHFMQQVRDRVVIIPEAKRLIAGLSGEKSVIVGGLHVPLLEKAFRGEKINPPMSWSSFVKSRSEEDQEAVKYVENLK